MFNERDFWENRYASGGTSGPGSSGDMALFKATVVNTLVAREKVESVIEFGCGDGRQLFLAKYPRYLGLDISPTAITLCKELFQFDPTKRFKLYDDYQGERADLGLSLETIFHLVNDESYYDYMEKLVGASTNLIVIFSSNRDAQDEAKHVRHRKFTTWMEKHAGNFSLVTTIRNPMPHKSFSNFYIYRKTDAQNPYCSNSLYTWE